MRIATIILATMFALSAMALDFIPVTAWPNVVYLGNVQYPHPPPGLCVKAGYRLLTPRPATPAGKQIKSETIIQDPDDASKCKYEITYEDIPAPPPVIPPVVPEVLVEVPATNVVFMSTTNGSPRGWRLKTMPTTNAAILESRFFGGGGVSGNFQGGGSGGVF